VLNSQGGIDMDRSFLKFLWELKQSNLPDVIVGELYKFIDDSDENHDWIVEIMVLDELAVLSQQEDVTLRSMVEAVKFIYNPEATWFYQYNENKFGNLNAKILVVYDILDQIAVKAAEKVLGEEVVSIILKFEEALEISHKDEKLLCQIHKRSLLQYCYDLRQPTATEEVWVDYFLDMNGGGKA
jgi:hypothetical protein